MKTLKLVQKSKGAEASKDRGVMLDDDLIGLFPQPRYFQVHFQHVHENTYDLQNELAQLKDYVAKVDAKLERMMALLSYISEQAL